VLLLIKLSSAVVYPVVWVWLLDYVRVVLLIPADVIGVLAQAVPRLHLQMIVLSYCCGALRSFLLMESAMWHVAEVRLCIHLLAPIDRQRVPRVPGSVVVQVRTNGYCVTNITIIRVHN